MSSLRNAVQRRNHKERAQPTERARWGLLEKRKDYQLRARDHKTKQRKLRALQEKARDRNEDEFYFGMMSSQSRGGVKIAKRTVENGGDPNLSPDVIQLMKTQDVAYLRTVLQQTRRERERLEQEVVIGDVGVRADPAGNSKRIAFGEDGLAVSRQAPQHQGLMDDEEDEEGSSDVVDGDADEEAQERSRSKLRRKRKVDGLREREQALATALRKLEDQRAKTNGTMGGTTKAGARFKIRRKR